jgi:DNA-binding transcriptional LysR family regulator
VLRAFIAVVNARGFTRAAEELGRTQPTISLQVKRLEELIEAPLFENNTRLILTKAGKTCLEYGREVVRQHDELFAQLAREAATDAPLRLGLPAELAGWIVAGLARDLAPFDIVCNASERLVAAYRSDQLDIALAATGAGTTGEAAQQWRMPLAWAAAPGYVAPRGEPLPLVTAPDNDDIRELAIAALERARRPFEIVCASADFGVVRSALAAGLGVGALMRGVAHDGVGLLADEAIAPLPDIALRLYFKPAALGGRAAKVASAIARAIGGAGCARVAA